MDAIEEPADLILILRVKAVEQVVDQEEQRIVADGECEPEAESLRRGELRRLRPLVAEEADEF